MGSPITTCASLPNQQPRVDEGFLFFFKKQFLLIGCAGSSLLCEGFSLIAERGGYSPVATHRLFIAVVFLVAEHGL